MRLSVAHLGATGATLAEVLPPSAPPTPPPLPAPVLSGSIAPIARQHNGSTVFTVAMAAQFTGTVTSYTISAPVGITINPGTGVVSIAAVDFNGASVSVRAVNAGGQSDPLTFTVTQTLVEGQVGPWQIKASTMTRGSTAIETPFGFAGDTLLVLTQSNGTTPANFTVPGETVVNINAAEQIAQDSYITQASYITLQNATAGLMLTSDKNCSVALVLNIGPHTLHAAARALTSQGLGGGTVAFPVFNDVPANSRVVYLHGVRTTGGTAQISGTGSLERDPLLPAIQAEYAERGSYFLVDTISLAAGGTTPAVNLAVSGSSRQRGRMTLVFAPAAASGQTALPGQYNADDNGPGLARSSEVSSFVVEDITYTLSEPAQVGHYATGNMQFRGQGPGDIWVRPIPPATTVTINASSPAYGTMADGRLGNGAMLNMVSVSGSGLGGPQGFVEAASFNPPFSAAARYVPGTAMSPGDYFVGSKAVPVASGAGRTEIEIFAPVHIRSDVPPADAFAPPIIWHPDLGARPDFAYSDVNESLLPSLSTVGITQTPPDLWFMTAQHKRRFLDWVSSQARYGMKMDRMGSAGNNYGENMQNDGLDAGFAYICSDVPIEKKRIVLRGLIQRGLDHYGALRSAYAQGFNGWMGPDGGHQVGRKAAILLAGHLLGDTTMRDWIRTNTDRFGSSAFAEDGHRAYLTAAAVTASQQPGWNAGGVGAPEIPYPDEMAEAPAVPEWMGDQAFGGVISPSQINNTWNGPSNFYRTTGHAEGTWGQATAMLVLGLRDAWNNPAHFDYQARIHGITYWKDDPWRYRNGNPTPRYPYINNGPTGSPGTTSWEVQFYENHIFQSPTYYTFPAGVNDFNGAT